MDIRNYRPSELLYLVDWAHFLFAWGFKGDAMRSTEALALKTEAEETLHKMEVNGTHVKACFKIVDAAREGDDILIYQPHETQHLPCLRQQRADKGCDTFRCLADYLAPVSRCHPIGNRLGIFATATHTPQLEVQQAEFQHLLLQTLSDRLAEAAAERLHREALHHEWGIPLDKPLSGIRPAVGYPSLPDMSINFLLDRILDFKNLGICLTENGMMIPHAAVSGLIFAHPEAKYFNVGMISEEQFHDYARRKGIAPQNLRKFIANIEET